MQIVEYRCGWTSGGIVSGGGSFNYSPPTFECTPVYGNVGGDYPGYPLDPIGGGGGAGRSWNGFPVGDISAELECALSSYAHSEAKKNGPIQKVDALAYGKWTPSGYVYEFSHTQVPLSNFGPGWVQVAGITEGTSTRWVQMFNRAFLPSTFNIDGTGRFGRADNHLEGSLTGLESAIYATAHELAHQNAIGYNADTGSYDELLANWYGIDAIKKYRADGGQKLNECMNNGG